MVIGWVDRDQVFVVITINVKVKLDASSLGTNAIYKENNKAALYHWSIVVVFFKYYISATKIEEEIIRDGLNKIRF